MNIKSKTSINNVVLLLGLMFSGCGMVSCEERPELSTPSGIPDGSVQVALCFEFSSENLKISRNGKPGTGSPEREARNGLISKAAMLLLKSNRRL